MPSDSHNSTMAKATGLIFSLFNAASAREIPFAILLYMQCILHGLTTALLCVPYMFVSMYVWMHAHMHVCRYICMDACTYVGINPCTGFCIYIVYTVVIWLYSDQHICMHMICDAYVCIKYHY